MGNLFAILCMSATIVILATTAVNIKADLATKTEQYNECKRKLGE